MLATHVHVRPTLKFMHIWHSLPSASLVTSDLMNFLSACIDEIDCPKAADTTGAAAAGTAGFEPLAGFDTFWYMWANVNEGSELLR